MRCTPAFVRSRTIRSLVINPMRVSELVGMVNRHRFMDSRESPPRVSVDVQPRVPSYNALADYLKVKGVHLCALSL